MQCEICKQREATVHIKEFKDGKCENHHFCIECAKAQEQQGPLSALGFNISDLLFKTVSGLEKKSGAAQNAAGESAPATPLTRCPVCNWSLKKIRKNNGKVGCPECYNIFSEVLRDALARIQKGTVHRGKTPRRTGRQSQFSLENKIAALQKQLADFVASEEYENAALCRDRIAALKQQLEEADK